MNRKIFTAIAIAALFAAFAVCSLLVVVSRRHPFFVAKKLRLGAAILSLSAMSVGCRDIGPTVMCYDIAAPDTTVIIDQKNEATGEIRLKSALSDTLTGTVSYPNSGAFSYVLKDSSRTVQLKGDLVPSDGTFDTYSERFRIVFNRQLPAGAYMLFFFNTPVDSVDTSGSGFDSVKIFIDGR